MGGSFKRSLQKLLRRRRYEEIAPDEIFLDSSNLPAFDQNQFEGRLEKPIGRSTVLRLGAFFSIIFILMAGQSYILQVQKGEAYTIQSEINRLRHGLIFAPRGVVTDRYGTELAWNVPSLTEPFPRRTYIEEPGFSHVLGYVRYPLRDTQGVYYQTEYVGTEGVERYYDDILAGENGLKIIETNALGGIESESVIRPPEEGESIMLSIDAELQSAIHTIIADIAAESDFDGGAGVIMDIQDGSVLALTSYPEYDSNVLAEGGPEDVIASYVANTGTPFLNRVTSGLYTPGSIVKPFVAIGALEEEIIDPQTQILSTGRLTIPNPFVEGAVSTFLDWRAHGLVDMRRAIAVSSNVYFYQVGGGYESQEGLGIERIEEYMRLFDIGELAHIDLPSEAAGVIPNPSWKEANFADDVWRIGDTYNTAIGQYGFQVTPIQMVRAVSAIANGGRLIEPHVRLGDTNTEVYDLSVEPDHFDIVREGMRAAVTEGSAQGMQFPDLSIAAKTGTAQVGANNQYLNSWIIGFFPYDEPRYAFAFIMERAPAGTLVGSVRAARSVFEWIIANRPEYAGLAPQETDN